jgi:hypothetical protein
VKSEREKKSKFIEKSKSFENEQLSEATQLRANYRIATAIIIPLCTTRMGEKRFLLFKRSHT